VSGHQWTQEQVRWLRQARKTARPSSTWNNRLGLSLIETRRLLPSLRKAAR
jgi:hypothetical protein